MVLTFLATEGDEKENVAFLFLFSLRSRNFILFFISFFAFHVIKINLTHEKLANHVCFCLKLNNGFDFFLPTEGDGERMAWLCSFCILVNFFLLCELARGEEAEIYCLNYKFAREHLGL